MNGIRCQTIASSSGLDGLSFGLTGTTNEEIIKKKD